MRVFAGLPLPAPAVERLQELCGQLQGRYPELRVVRPQALHITMVFFGDLAQEAVLRVMRAMDRPELRVATIQAVIAGVGRFPASGRPRVIFCPLRKGAPEVSRLQRLFVQVLAAAGQPAPPEQRPFTPHITLARNRASAVSMSWIEELFAFEHSLILDRLVLYQSVLKPGGAQYKSLKTLSLQ